MKKIHFPKRFLWGTATSAHQVEGNNIMNDWWQWEQTRDADRSGDACNHYELFEKDFDIAKSLNTNIHRFSIEWSRVEPEKDRWNEEEIQHYHKVLDALIERGIEPMVTLHHFTNPSWIAKDGGWESKKTAECFGVYARRIAGEFAGKVKWWLTINEPMVYVNASYKQGLWPPQVKDAHRAKTAMRNMLDGHRKAYSAIHEVAELENKSVEVGFSKNFLYFVPCSENSLKDKLAVYFRDLDYNQIFSGSLAGGRFAWISLLIGKTPDFKRALDFIGLNYYVKDCVKWDSFGLSIEKLKGRLCTWECKDYAKGYEINDLGWLIAPDGMYAGLKSLSRYGLPIMITENGTCTGDDSVRQRFIKDHLFQVAKAIGDGINVIGYIHWSLLDNFEWHEGFAPRFGLVEVDYNNQARTPRESARMYGQICKEGGFEYDGFKKAA